MSRPAPGPPWSVPIRLSEIVRLAQPLMLEPNADERARIAKALGLVELTRFSAEVRLTPWLDGVELDGRWSADVVYRCGVTVEPFEAALKDRFNVRAVPPSSPQARPPEETDVIEVDLDADDPPDILEAETIDVAAYLIEHLALELDPFPRKPGAVFEPPPPENPESPFAILSRLKPAGGDGEG